MAAEVETGRGNLLESDTEALVNTVNSVGVMGKGIALQFRKAFPEVFSQYKRACDAGEVRPGRMLVTPTERLGGPRMVINFPTKRHWRGRSKLEDIESGLADLVRVVREYEVSSIAIPPLGCGNGGLDWREVRPVIERALEQLEDVRVVIYEPDGPPESADQPVRTEAPRMTHGRAALLLVLDAFRADPFTDITRLVAQKLAYFLQVAGEDLRLAFVKGQYGPYAETLNHALLRMDGHFISGFGDRESSTAIMLDPDALDDARKFAADRNGLTDRVGDVAALIDGFESPFGLELLASVHWSSTQGRAATLEEVETYLEEWGPRKRDRFDPKHLKKAWSRLASEGWLG